MACCGAAASPIIPVSRGCPRPSTRTVAARRTAACPGGSAAHFPRHLSTSNGTEALSDIELRIGSGGSDRAHRIERIGSGESGESDRIGQIGAGGSGMGRIGERADRIGLFGSGGLERADRIGRIGSGRSRSKRISERIGASG